MGYDEKRFIELAVESQAINPKEELEKLVEQIKLVICSDFDKNAEEVKLRTFNFNVPGDQQKIAHLRFLTQAKQARILDGVKLSEIFYSLQNDVEKGILNQYKTFKDIDQFDTATIQMEILERAHRGTPKYCCVEKKFDN